MELKIKNFKLKSPFIVASGTFGSYDELADFCELDKIGAISTKGTTYEPRLGNEGVRIFELDYGMINRIGLENDGIFDFIENKLPILKEKNIPFLLNIAGSVIEDYVKCAKIAQENNIEAIELNVSCPNVKSGAMEFGVCEESLKSLVEQVRAIYSGCLIIKLTPNVTKIENMAYVAQCAGADAICAINTVKSLGVKIEYINNKFKKTLVAGGLSGKCIKQIALSAVSRIKEVVNIPIIALGGISTLEDVFEFISVGADFFQIGTQNFKDPNICSRLNDELNNFIVKNGFRDYDELKEKLREM